MSRKKPKVVDTVRHADSGVTVEIKLNPDNLAFECRLPDGTLWSDANGKDLGSRVYKWLSENMRLEWLDAIQIEALTPFARGSGNFVGFNIYRFHYARKIGGEGGYVKADWGCRPDDEEDHFGVARKCGWTYVHWWSPPAKEFSLPYATNNRRGLDNEGEYYLPYSEETWLGLEKMIVAIREIRKQLNKMLADPMGHAYIAAIGASILKALPAVASQEEE